jgi:hypothetical protein
MKSLVNKYLKENKTLAEMKTLNIENILLNVI